MASGYDSAIEKLKEEIETHIASLKGDPAWVQIEKLATALATIEALADQPRTSLIDLFGIGDVQVSAKSTRVRQGEFYGLAALDAAKQYLKRKGEAAMLDEIMSAVIEIGRANKVDKEQLRMSLSRSTWDVAKVDEDLYGLLEFFPHIKRGKKKAQQGKEVAEAATDDRNSGEGIPPDLNQVSSEDENAPTG